MFIIVASLSFFLGIIAILYEKRHFAHNRQTIIHHAEQLRATCADSTAYHQQLRTFLENNAFMLVQTPQGLSAARKIFSPGIFLLGFACAIIGAIVYVIYFRFFAKAKQIPLPPFEPHPKEAL